MINNSPIPSDNSVQEQTVLIRLSMQSILIELNRLTQDTNAVDTVSSLQI